MEGKMSASNSMDSFCKTASLPTLEESNKPDTSIVSYTTGKVTLDAEIMWAMKCVKSHYSYNSCQGNGELFSKMFPDSTIAKQFALSERKCSYWECSYEEMANISEQIGEKKLQLKNL